MKDQYNPFAAASQKLNFKQYAERPRREPQAGDTGTIEPLKRNPFYGVPSDIARALHESTIRNPEQITGAELLSDFIGIPAIAKTLDRLSFGDRLTENTGQATRVLPETTSAVMAALPFAQAAAGATRTGRNIGRVISGKHSPLSAASEEFARVRSPNERAARVSEKGWVGPVATGDEFGVTPPRSSRVVKGTNLVHTHPPHPSGKLNPLSAADRDAGPVHVLHADPRGALTGYYDSLMSGQPPELNQPMSQLDYVRRLMADPTFSSNTAENMYTLTGELDPSMLTGGLQALRPKGGNVNLRNFDDEFPGNNADLMKRNREDARNSIAANARTINRVEEEIAKYTAAEPTEETVRKLRALHFLRRDLQDRINEDNFLISDVDDRLPVEEWFGKNLRRYFEREHASTDDSLIKMADRRHEEASNDYFKAFERHRKAQDKHDAEADRWREILKANGNKLERLPKEQQDAFNKFAAGADSFSQNLNRARIDLADAEADRAVRNNFLTPFSQSELSLYSDELPVTLDEIFEKRIAAGQPEHGVAKSRTGATLESLIDAGSYMNEAADYLPRELEYLNLPTTLPPNTPIFKLGSETPVGEKFKDLEDYLLDLIRSGALTPEELSRMTPTMVMERKLNEEMQRALDVDRKARHALEFTPVVKEYDDKSRWVNLRPTVNDRPTAEKILAHESQHLNHCIGQECYRNTYLERMMEGSHDYYSLRDENGVPMVTIEAKSPMYKSKRRYSELSQAEKEEIAKTSALENPLEVNEQRNPFVYTRQDNTHHLIPAGHTHQLAEHDVSLQPMIKQIKGHGNQPAIAKYQDRITDFLTDLNPHFIQEESRYHRMMPAFEALTNEERAAAQALGIQLPRYVSPIRRDEIRQKIGSSETAAPAPKSDPGYTVDPDADIGLFD